MATAADGHFREMVFIFRFDRTGGIRWTHSPSWGGFNTAEHTTNPASDWQYRPPKNEVKQEYSSRARVAYWPKCSRGRDHPRI